MKILKRMAIAATAVTALISAADATAQWSTTGNSLVGSEFLGSTNATDVNVRTTNIERMRITSGGLVGINTSSTTVGRLLHIHNSSSEPQLILGETSTSYWEFGGGENFHIYDAATGSPWIDFSPLTSIAGFSLGPNFEVYSDITNGGKFGFGTDINTLVGRAMVNGHVVPATDNASNAGTTVYRWDTVFACNGTIQTSDAKFKENIHDINYGIDDVMRLHPVSYAWKGHTAEGRQIGLLAQEIQPVISEVVKGDEGDSQLGVFYSDFVPVLIKALQDQQEEIGDRARENQMLRDQMDKRAERIARLEAAVEALP